MSRLSEGEKENVRNMIIQYPERGNEEIAQALGVPVRCVVSIRNGLKTKNRFGEIPEMDRASVRKLIKLGKSNEEIANRLGIGLEDVQLIRTRITQNRIGSPLLLHDIASPNNKKADNYTSSEPESIEIKQVIEIFKETARILSNGSDKAGYLLYRDKSQGFCPREIDAQLVMSNILSKYKCYHMIESPTVESDTHGYIDLSIYNPNRTRFVDVEFKEAISNADNDFPKLAVSPAMGSAVFFISNHNSINFVLSKITSTYSEIYKRVFNEIAQESIKDKWFIFFLMCFKKNRTFLSFFKSIKSVDFSELLRSEIK